jgi:sterol desaturase/sphingolipid hydroxylase (fatty acid hydroxylase superfamily)
MNEKEILLKEYETCQKDNQAEASSYWTILGIFVSINTAIIGGLAYGLFSTNFINAILNLKTEDIPNIIVKLIMLTILFVVIIIITNFLESWLDRSNYLIQNNYRRMHEIEIELGMWKNLRIHILDKWNRIRKRLKYDTNPCATQNKEIWEHVWEGLKVELTKDNYNSLRREKTRIEAMPCQKSGVYTQPNRDNVTVLFWAIHYFWILAFIFLWSLFIGQFSLVWIRLIYGIFAIIMILDFYFRRRKRKKFEAI